MRIYSGVITGDDVRAAFTAAREQHDADIRIDGDIRTWNPRAARYGTEVYAYSNNGKRATGHLPSGLTR